MVADTETLAERAKVLADLHRGDRPLLLPNAWDAASAQVLSGAGFPAVATSSSAVAASLGYRDGEAAPAAEMLAAVARITAVTPVPVTADLEAGYGLPPAEVVERLLEAGAVGCNLEDSDNRAGGLVDAERQAERLAEVRAAANRAGVGVVINARVDVYLHQVGTPGQRVEEALRRARLYLEAGADCVYPILVSDEWSIGELVRDAGGPVNVLYQQGMPSLQRLGELGVARISFGGGLHRATQMLLQRLAERILEGGDPYGSRGGS
jgi:2-methylisocitrate lyase-like PEP mutase family enzyme